MINGKHSFRPFLTFVTAFFFIFLLAERSYCQQHSNSQEIELTIIHTNDIHSHILPFDAPGIAKNVGGAERLHAYIKNVKKTNSATLVLDAGDIFQGTPFYTFFKGEAEMGAMTLCGYDATTLGNHDLDDGLDNLLKQLKKADFSFLCANVFYKGSNKPVFDAFKIFERGGLKIAVIGAIGKSAWDVIPAKYLEKIYHADETAIANNIAAKLRKHVDIIILLSHLGYEPDLAFARNSPNVDIVVGGHTNTTLKKPVLIQNSADNGIGGTIVLQGFKWGIYAGRLDIKLKGDKKISEFEGRLDLMDSSVKTSKKTYISKYIESFNEIMKDKISLKLGVSEAEMTYSDDTRHRRDLPLGIYICDILNKTGTADFAIINSGAIRDFLPSGEISIAAIMKTLPFDNGIATLELTGRDVAAIFDFIAANYGNVSGYQFSSSLSFTLDLKNKKACDIKIKNAALDPEKTYKIATISYMAEGNQNGGIFFKNARNVTDNGYYLRDAVIEYIKANPAIKPPATRVMNIIP